MAERNVLCLDNLRYPSVCICHVNCKYMHKIVNCSSKEKQQQHCKLLESKLETFLEMVQEEDGEHLPGSCRCHGLFWRHRSGGKAHPHPPTSTDTGQGSKGRSLAPGRLGPMLSPKGSDQGGSQTALHPLPVPAATRRGELLSQLSETYKLQKPECCKEYSRLSDSSSHPVQDPLGTIPRLSRPDVGQPYVSCLLT